MVLWVFSAATAEKLAVQYFAQYQHLIELVWTGKLFGASFACLGLGLSTGKPFRTYWALKDAKGPELSSVVSESW